MANVRVLLKKSGVLGKLPTAAEYGELFLNYHSGDPMLCFKDNAGEIVQIKPARSVDGGGGETPPTTGNVDGDTLWNGSQILVWNTDAWIPVGPADLAYVQKTDKGEVTSTAGSGFEIPSVNNAQAGLMLPADKNNLDSLVAGGASLWEIEGSSLKPKDYTKDVNINSGKIELKASNGNVSAAGNGNFDGKLTAGSTVEGAGGIFDNGTVKVFLSSGDGALYGYDSNDLSDPTSSINKDGSCAFKNVTCAYQASGNTLIDGDGITITSSNAVAGALTSNGLNLGGAIPAAPNISLSAATGSGIFASYVQAGPSAIGGTETGAYLLAQGVVGATRASGADILWSGYKTGSADPTSTISAGGSIATAGSLSVAGGIFEVNSNGQAYGRAFLADKASSDASLTFRGKNASGTTTFSVLASGSIEAAGTVKTEGINSYFTANRTGTLAASAALYLGFNNGTQKFKVGQGGEITAAGNAFLGENTGSVVQDKNGTIVGANGFIDIYKDSANSNNFLAGYKTGSSSPRFSIDATGAIQSGGSINAAKYIQSGGSPFTGVNIGSTMVETGSVNCTAASSTDPVWSSYTHTNSTPTVQILASGKASYAGSVIGNSGNAAGIIGGDFRSNDASAGASAIQARNFDDAGFTFQGRKSNGSITFSVMSDGSANFAGTVTATVVPPSDARFKENIAPAKPQLADVVALGGILKNYDWNDQAPVNEELRSQRQLGLVAQEVAEVCPSLVKTVKRTETVEVTPAVVGPKGKVITEAVTKEIDDSYAGLSTDALIMKLIGAVAELSAEVEELKKAS